MITELFGCAYQSLLSRELIDLHGGYEQAKEYPLKRRENPKAPLN